jgi:hypothetical protein
MGGLVAGEGCFRWTERRERFPDGSPRLRFVFELSLASEDRPVLEVLAVVLGAGSIQDRGERRAGWLPESRLTIASESAHLAHTIPFTERYLVPCRKREQFEAWRDRLLSYRAARPSRSAAPACCSRPGCQRPVRARGLCRPHYYEVTGN